jgi:predicted DNA-binding protein
MTLDRRFTVRLATSTYRTLAAIAEKKGETIGAIVRQFIEKNLSASSE